MSLDDHSFDFYAIDNMHRSEKIKFLLFADNTNTLCLSKNCGFAENTVNSALVSAVS